QTKAISAGADRRPVNGDTHVSDPANGCYSSGRRGDDGSERELEERGDRGDDGGPTGGKTRDLRVILGWIVVVFQLNGLGFCFVSGFSALISLSITFIRSVLFIRSE
ncbi:hypothetical protein GWI33_011297, partial [Rhynchophorus ferrugineus]